MKRARNPLIVIGIVALIMVVAIGKDYYFLTNVHPDFDKNVMGTISVCTCMGDRAYRVKYIINDHSQDFIWLPIDDIVDIATWKELPNDIAPVANYEDANHLYGIHCMSDVWVTCRKKCFN